MPYAKTQNKSNNSNNNNNNKKTKNKNNSNNNSSLEIKGNKTIKISLGAFFFSSNSSSHIGAERCPHPIFDLHRSPSNVAPLQGHEAPRNHLIGSSILPGMDEQKMTKRRSRESHLQHSPKSWQRMEGNRQPFRMP